MQSLRHPDPWVRREEQLHEWASRLCGGLDDFGDPSYLEGFRRLLYAYDEEARFHSYGRFLAQRQILHHLCQRLLTQEQWRRNPSLLETPVQRPVVITGLPRSGTTALHFLLAVSPHFQHLPYWLASRPQPRPDDPFSPLRPAHLLARWELFMMYQIAGGLRPVHHLTASGPEECRHFLAQTFTDDTFEIGNHIPSYSRWYASRDHIATYRRHRQLLQTVGVTRPEHPWLLKYPAHLRHLKAFLATYPDARFIHLHRDPAAVFPSYVSMAAHFRQVLERDFDAACFARQQSEVWAAALENAAELRRDPEIDARFFDVEFQDFVENPVRVVEDIHQALDLPLHSRTQRALKRHLASHPRNKHGTHRYSRSDFGLKPAQIHERFSHYLETYDLCRLQ